jgi:hypothetical protein
LVDQPDAIARNFGWPTIAKGKKNKTKKEKIKKK